MDIRYFKRPPRRLLADLLRREHDREFPENLHVLDPEARIWRSGQPVAGDLNSLSDLGFRSVLNLRRHHSDQPLLAGTGIREYRYYFHLPANDDMIRVLRIVRRAEKPLLIHCWHGSDRTGAVAVGYRIVFNGWTLNEALNEFLTPCYGHHPRLYWALPRVLRRCDWKRIAAAVEAD